MTDPGRLFLFRLADRLNKTVSEIEHLPETEIFEWAVFFENEAG